jgi:hypothetical protein
MGMLFMNMDKYFCSHCLNLWKQDKTMNGCQGCDGHIKSGWSCQQLVEIYEPIMASSEIDRAYFPFLNYLYQPRLISNPKNTVTIKQMSTMMSNTTYMIGFKKQQLTLFRKYKLEQTDTNWNSLHVFVQRMAAPQIKTYYKPTRRLNNTKI